GSNRDWSSEVCSSDLLFFLDSLLDRLRILEEKMEQGIPVQAVQAAAPGQIPAQAAETQGIYPSGEAAPTVKPTKAAPEDLQKILDRKSVVQARRPRIG